MVLLYLSAMGEGLSSLMRCFFKRIRPSSSSSSTASSSSSNNSANSSVSGGPNTKSPPSLNTEKRSHVGYPTNSWSTTQLSTSLNNYSSNGGYGASNLPSGSGGCKKHRQSVVPISICIMILICYVTLGAVLFHKIQPWGVLESLYFCFTSLGTIGFGDLQPKGQVSQYAAAAYILIGMAVVAMCFSLIQTELIIWLRKFGVQDSTTFASNTQLNEDVALVTVALTPIKSS
jgi:potassium channel subfamily K member 18